MTTKTRRRLDHVTIRFAGDSGDGMQLTGDRFTSATARIGNDLATLPDFPAEIRAPAGSLSGVSGFQLHFADHDILTPGDAPDVLVAMNPAALKTNLGDLEPSGMLVVNTDAFTKANLRKAHYEASPLDDGSLARYQVFAVPITQMTVGALSGHEISSKDKQRAKNMFALGLMSFMFSRPTAPTIEWLAAKFARRPEIAAANIAAFKAGWAFGETAEVFAHSYEVSPAPLAPGRYRQITGNLALAYGLIAASQRSRLPLFLGSYPITPASDILHELSRHKRFGIVTMQAEDEIAGICAALGASFAGSLGVTATSGPGLALKTEAIGLALSVELPLVIVDIQRGGPSTGLPTKTEQADLLQAMYGRNGEAPVPIIAPSTASDCFDAAIEAARIAIKYRTPVLLLSDGYLANGAEPWRIPEVDELPDLSRLVRFQREPNHEGEFWPFLRDDVTLARPWAVPGTPGLEHRIGGLEKADGTGNISYDPDNHHRMTRLRAAKVAGIAHDLPLVEVDWGEAVGGRGSGRGEDGEALGGRGSGRGEDGEAVGGRGSGRGEDGEALAVGAGRPRVLVIGWGSTYGPIRAAVRSVRSQGLPVARTHLRHLNPFPANLGEVLRGFERVLVPEMNLGQLSLLLRARYLVDARGYNRVRGLPFTSRELASAIAEFVRETAGGGGQPWR